MFNRRLFWVTLLLLALLVGTCSRLRNQQAQHDQQTSVMLAVQDSVHYYRDHYGREVASKRAMEADLKTVEASYRLLSDNQKSLVQDVKHLPKSVQKKLVAASSVKQVVRIRQHTNVDSVADMKQSWTLTSDTLTYAIHVHGDTLRIDSLTVPNRLVVMQYRDSKDVLHVTATNTNPMLKTLDVDASIPPQKPSKFHKALLVAAGIGLGFLIAK